jgi:hypothetical protein
MNPDPNASNDSCCYLAGWQFTPSAAIGWLKDTVGGICCAAHLSLLVSWRRR